VICNKKGYRRANVEGKGRGIGEVNLTPNVGYNHKQELLRLRRGKEVGTTMSDEVTEKRGASLALARIGNAEINVSDEQLGNGYTVGYLRYLLDDAGKLLSERDIYEFIMGRLQDVRETDRWNVGVVMGWIVAMQKTREQKKP